MLNAASVAAATGKAVAEPKKRKRELEARRFFECSYADKDDAKALGAKWDTAAKKWYVREGLSIGAFARWLPPVGAKKRDCDCGLREER